MPLELFKESLSLFWSFKLSRLTMKRWFVMDLLLSMSYYFAYIWAFKIPPSVFFYTVLVAVQYGTMLLEEYLVISSKNYGYIYLTEQSHFCDSVSRLQWPKYEMTCTGPFIGALVIIAKEENNPNVHQQVTEFSNPRAHSRILYSCKRDERSLLLGICL